MTQGDVGSLVVGYLVTLGLLMIVSRLARRKVPREIREITEA